MTKKTSHFLPFDGTLRKGLSPYRPALGWLAGLGGVLAGIVDCLIKAGVALFKKDTPWKGERH